MDARPLRFILFAVVCDGLLRCLSMNALFYPFHLCHPKTLDRLLETNATIHFRDYMALQLTPLVGSMAVSDRMGDTYPALLAEGRIRHGHNVSGPLPESVQDLVNRDLQDREWRARFHEAVQHDVRMQQGLFPHLHRVETDRGSAASHALPAPFADPVRRDEPLTVDTVRERSRSLGRDDAHLSFDYGFALVTTSASLVYTIQLCERHHLVAVTDSPTHYRLLELTCAREQVVLVNQCVDRQGY